jgi:hypothetical protein
VADVRAAAAARSWLEANSAGAPPALLARMLRALDDTERTTAAGVGSAPEGVPGALSAAALTCLREALERCDERHAALHLLAADALITAACEAAVDVPDSAGPLAQLRTLCEAFDPGGMAGLAELR